MSDGTQIVAGALDAHIRVQEIAARNVANIVTPGFKRNIALLESADGTDGGETTDTPAVTGVRLDLSQGALLPTGNALDFAIQGRGFFTVQGENGVRYTRNGNFRLDENRILVTQNGARVLGEAGEIQVPETDSDVMLTPEGVLRAGEQSVARLQITDFDHPELLRQSGSCEFDGDSAAPKPAAGHKLYQRHLEASNVEPINELIHMMASLRDYEASARSLRAIEDSAAKLYGWAGTF